MDEVAAESVSQPRFRAQLVGSFAALALGAQSAMRASRVDPAEALPQE